MQPSRPCPPIALLMRLLLPDPYIKRVERGDNVNPNIPWTGYWLLERKSARLLVLWGLWADRIPCLIVVRDGSCDSGKWSSFSSQCEHLRSVHTILAHLIRSFRWAFLIAIYCLSVVVGVVVVVVNVSFAFVFCRTLFQQNLTKYRNY